MAFLETEQLWQRAFPDVTRPLLYLGDDEDEDNFKPLADPQDFITDIAELSKLQLYASSSNNQLALKQAQAEYLDISTQIAALKGKQSKAKNPRVLLDAEDFEDHKEASLYGYKYEANKPALLHNGVIGIRSADDITDQEKRDVRLFQDPFSQGGFVPTERQYKALQAKATNRNNTDGWQPIVKDGKRLIPQQNIERPEYTNIYVRRNIDENGEIIRPGSSGTDDSIATPNKVENKRLTRTRFGGKKVPPTRDVSEAPSTVSTPGRKRLATPTADGQDGTPSKRRRVNLADPDRPKHPNQYTKARELAAKDAAKSGFINEIGSHHSSNSAVMPDWSAMTREQLLARKWTDEELVDSIKKDHSWLHPDPAKALEWRDKIVNGVNPVRSWSMVKKWEEWKVTNKDKRPRKKAGEVGTPRQEVTPAATVREGVGAGELSVGEIIVAIAGDVKMERVGSERGVGSEDGSDRARKAPRLKRTQSARGVDRSATVTPNSQPRRSMRKK